MFKNAIIKIFIFLFYTTLIAIWIYIYSFSILFGYQLNLMCLIIFWGYIFCNNTKGYILYYYIILLTCLCTLLLATIIQTILLDNSNLTKELFFEFGNYYKVTAVFSSVVSTSIVLIFFLHNFNSKKTNDFIHNIILTMFFWVYLIIVFSIITS